MPLVADAVALAILGWMTWRGGRRGLAMGLAGLAQGAVIYVGAWSLGGVIARWLDSGATEPGLKALAVGFLLGGVFLIVVTEILLLALRRRGHRRQETPTEAPRDAGRFNRIGGLALGAVGALLLIAFLAWIYSLLGIALGPRLPAADGSLTSALSRMVMRPLLYPFARRLSPEGDTAALAARALSDPASSVAAIRCLAENPDVAALARDRSFGESVLNGDAAAIRRNPSFRRVMENPDSAESLRRIGGLRAAPQTEESHEEMAQRLSVAGRNLRRLLEDPETQSVLNDPELKRRAEAGDWRGLVEDPRVRRLIGRVLAPPGG